jgi:phenylacetate-CoA ligase
MPPDSNVAHYEFLLRSQYSSADELAAFQRKELSALVKHARRHVPFYADRLEVVIRTDGSMDWDRWKDIPIVTRTDLIDNFDTMQARKVPPSHGRSWPMESSGSTGHSVRVTYNELFARTNVAFNWRAASWQGCDWSQIMLTRTGGFNLVQGPAFVGAPWGPPTDPSSYRGRHVDMGKKTDPETALRFMERLKPAYFTTGGNTLHVYAMEARRLGLHIPLRSVFSHGETITEEGRAAILDVFGAPAFERYSSREAGRMAHACTHQRGMHVNMEKVLVEIIDEQGRECPSGVEGRVIVTPFYNTHHPLIRYDQGDLAYWGGPCSCGRTLPVIAKVTGRTSAIFRHPSGRSTHEFYPETAREKLRCGIWQVAQTGALEFEVRYVPNDWEAPADEEAAAQIFRETYFSDASVTFVRTRTLRATPADKYLEYVYEAPN